jgi:hypothetical protein
MIREEKICTLWDEALPLLNAHWREITHYADIPLDPDIETYNKMEAIGALRCFTARDQGRLVGYAVFFIRHNLHYRSSLQAMQDVLFVLPEYRGMLGIKLIRESERLLTSAGAQVLYHHVKRTNKVGELLVRMGYELIDEIYGKRLDQEASRGR